MQSALIADAVVLAAVPEADLGSHRKITRFRLLRPLLLAAAALTSDDNLRELQAA